MPDSMIPDAAAAPLAQGSAALAYQSGFGNEFATEAVPGALPVGQNSPQRPPLGLYAEGLSGTAFTAPRAHNRRTWLYRIRPSADHGPFRRIDQGLVRTGPFDAAEPSPNRLRWSPRPLPVAPQDFIDSLATLAGSGSPEAGAGLALHTYAANRSMRDRALFNADGEMLIVPQEGRLRLVTEMGILEAAPLQVALVPRGVRFRVELLDGAARGYVGENYGQAFRLPELGPIGSNGLANPRDFLSPVAAFERGGPTQLVQKFQGGLWAADLDRSPFDVVAWHGSYVPWVYDLTRFNVIGTVSYDHPDPSIFTVVTSPSDTPGIANADFVIFPPRWQVAEHTFRPPWFHRNVMNELMGLITGAYDAKAEGFEPGGASLHNCMSAHGPDVATWRQASDAELSPQRIDGTMAFMFETRQVLRPTSHALAAPELQSGYDQAWQGFPANFTGG